MHACTAQGDPRRWYTTLWSCFLEILLILSRSLGLLLCSSGQKAGLYFLCSVLQYLQLFPHSGFKKREEREGKKLMEFAPPSPSLIGGKVLHPGSFKYLGLPVALLTPQGNLKFTEQRKGRRIKKSKEFSTLSKCWVPFPTLDSESDGFSQSSFCPGLGTPEEMWEMYFCFGGTSNSGLLPQSAWSCLPFRVLQ